MFEQVFLRTILNDIGGDKYTRLTLSGFFTLGKAWFTDWVDWKNVTMELYYELLVTYIEIWDVVQDRITACTYLDFCYNNYPLIRSLTINQTRQFVLDQVDT